MKDKEQMGWPEASVYIAQALTFLAVIYFIASCTAGHSLI